MPIYEYKCESCGRVISDMRKEKDKDNPINDCPLCCEEPRYARKLAAPPHVGTKVKGNMGNH